MDVFIFPVSSRVVGAAPLNPISPTMPPRGRISGPCPATRRSYSHARGRRR
ncbi:Uncharacterised protein [Bordetella pertussis]|nr:Uncharacterised protein [Bordetella pertussis]